MSDNVNHPSHYTFGEIECIDAIHAALGDDGFLAYCEGNAIKYLWRYRIKGGRESIAKARWYIDRMLDMMGELVVPLDKADEFFGVISDSEKAAFNGLKRVSDYIYGKKQNEES